MEKFDRLKKNLKLPPRISFTEPPFFEGNQFSMKLLFRNQSEFDEMIRILNRISEEKRLKELETLLS